ncbi:MAG: ATP-binding protein [Butyrivibrio sp.]|nr:ATP-binding protein [Butyrivibrio sp.]
MEELRIEADINNLNKAIEFVDKMLEEVNCSPEVMAQIDIAIEEIFVNIASYAYAPEKGDVVIKAGLIDGYRGVQVTFIDSGVPFNPLEKADPDVDQPIEDRPIGGLGVYMVKMSMDKVLYEYKDEANMLSIIKKLDSSSD